MRILNILTRQDPQEDGLPDEDANGIDEIPVYSINKPKDETLAVLKILNNVKGPQKVVKKNRLLEKLEEVGLVDKNLSGAGQTQQAQGSTKSNKCCRRVRQSIW